MKLLSPTQRRELRAKAHHLEPVVMVGNAGLTPAVLHEVDINLRAHELIKVRVFSDEREARETLLREICERLDAAPVQHIGKLLVLYRERPPEVVAAAEPVAERPGRRPSPRSRQQEKLIAARRRPRPGTTPAVPAEPRPKARGRKTQT